VIEIPVVGEAQIITAAPEIGRTLVGLAVVVELLGKMAVRRDHGWASQPIDRDIVLSRVHLSKAGRYLAHVAIAFSTNTLAPATYRLRPSADMSLLRACRLCCTMR
jgi:hypothetical protein